MEDPRAYGPLTKDHLATLSEIARVDREGLFNRCPHLAFYRDRILTVALCQGGALHFVNGRNGVKDLDVWTLYSSKDGVMYPPRRTGQMLGCSLPGLGCWSERVDLLGRSIPVDLRTDPAQAWREYLDKPQTSSAWWLRQKPVVLVEPASRRGEIVWQSKL